MYFGPYPPPLLSALLWPCVLVCISDTLFFSSFPVQPTRRHLVPFPFVEVWHPRTPFFHEEVAAAPRCWRRAVLLFFFFSPLYLNLPVAARTAFRGHTRAMGGTSRPPPAFGRLFFPPWSFPPQLSSRQVLRSRSRAAALRLECCIVRAWLPR